MSRSLTLALLIALALAPAARADLGWGFGFRIPGSDVSIGLDYHRSRWGEHVGTRVWVHPRPPAHPRPDERTDRERAERRDREERAPTRPGDNVTLRVQPGNCRVLLNGVRIEAFGRDSLRLPPGVHRLEFLRAEYRGLELELDVLPGRQYWIEERLARLEDGERADPRLDDPAPAVSVSRALAETRALWERADRSGVLPRESREPDR